MHKRDELRVSYLERYEAASAIRQFSMEIRSVNQYPYGISLFMNSISIPVVEKNESRAIQPEMMRMSYQKHNYTWFSSAGLKNRNTISGLLQGWDR